MKPMLVTLTLISLLSAALSLSLSSCTPTGSRGAAAMGDGGYTAPAPSSSVDRTDSMRGQFRDWR